jgi:hypothetical protein
MENARPSGGHGIPPILNLDPCAACFWVHALDGQACVRLRPSFLMTINESLPMETYADPPWVALAVRATIPWQLRA